MASTYSGVIDLLSYARVAKWQTRRLQVPVPARAWGFKSPLAHVSDTRSDQGFTGGGGFSFCLHVLNHVLRGFEVLGELVDSPSLHRGCDMRIDIHRR